MNDLEYNSYIENYIENDKTKSAIMLIAPWGMGKSYYIQNSLVPYLEGERGKKCVVVSLYGMNDIKEISKAIYLEIRSKKVREKNEKKEAEIIIGKTIVKGVLNKVGIDISLKEEDLEKLYASIDLSDKLLILEDLERTDISISQVLGYVNNLVEQDGAKVLLVANENEIKKLKKVESKNKDGKNVDNQVYSNETKEYLKIKEKTVSDTISYLCDYDTAIQNILNMFSNDNIDKCLKLIDTSGKSIVVSEIMNVMAEVGCYNLRSLIFACQKTVDIFSKYTGDINFDFFKHVFFGNIAFSLRLKGNDSLKWNEKTNPNELGTGKYPLYKFCYEYIKYQELYVSEIEINQTSFLEWKEYEKKQRESNTALNILYNFVTQNEDNINCAVEKIRDDLKKGEIIPLAQYGKLANYLVAVKNIVSKPEVVDECKVIILENLKEADRNEEKILDRLRFHDSFVLWENEQKEEYRDFTEEMISVFQNCTFKNIENDEPIEYLNNVIIMLSDNSSSVNKRKVFMGKIDINKMLLGLKKASAEQVSEFRSGILTIYGIVNIRDFLPDDKDALVELKTGVQNILQEDESLDKVVRLQCSWLVDNLQSVLENYS